MNSDVFGPTGELRITKMDALHPSPHVALVFALLLVAELISKFIIKLKPLNVLAVELRELRARMRSLRAEMEPLNNPSTFAAFSKKQRELNKLEAREQELAQTAPPPPTSLEVLSDHSPRLIKYGAFIFICFYFWSEPMFIAPTGTSWFLERANALEFMLPFSRNMTSWPTDALGVLPLLFVFRPLISLMVNSISSDAAPQQKSKLL